MFDKKGDELFNKLIVHQRISQRHSSISDDDVECAWRNAIVIQSRSYDPPDQYAAAGADCKGRMLEMVGVEIEDGSLLIYHAMTLTKKMRKELGL